MGKLLVLLRRAATFVSRNNYILAIQRACIMLIPVIFINSLCYVIGIFPVRSFQAWMDNGGSMLRALAFLVVRVNSSYLGIIFALMVGVMYSPGKEHSVVIRLSCGLVCVYSFMIFVAFGRQGFNPLNLGSRGMFSAILTGAVSCPLYYRMTDYISVRFRRYHHRMNSYLASAVKTAPALFFIPLIFYAVRDLVWCLTGASCFEEFLFDDLARFALDLFPDGSLIQNVFYTMMVQIIWLTGTNGGEMLNWFMQSHMQHASYVNRIALVNGGENFEVLTKEVCMQYQCIGGTGSLLALTLLVLLLGRRRQDRTIGKLGIIPSIFNISEPMAFGLPILMNPVFALPFIFVPVMNLLIAYGALTTGLVPPMTGDVKWTMPVFLSGYAACGSIRGALLQGIILAADCAVYYPFLRIHESFQLERYNTQIRQLEQFVKEKELVEEPFRTRDVPYPVRAAASALSADLRMDLEAGLLKVYYQPQISASGDYCGAEALLRWEHPVAGFVYPPLIVGLARENGFLDELEDFVFSSAARVIRKLEKGGEFEPKVSVNITGTSMAYSGFEDMIDRVVENAGIKREHLWIEITEQESIASTRELTRLRNKGHKLLIDDFGMGHTSIYYLETGLFDVVKLDGSVTCKIMTDDSVHAIVDSVIRLSHRLGMTVVAEFVETEVQQDILCTMGCDVYQGSLYSGPVPEEEFFDSLCELAHKGMCPCQYARMKEAE